MTTFNYVALDNQGKREKGVIEAESAIDARRWLRERGYLPLTLLAARKSEVTPVSVRSFSLRTVFIQRIKPSELALMTRQMATLLSAGLPIDEVLTAVIKQSERTKIKRLLYGVRAKILEGYSLANALNEYPKLFSSLYRSTVRAGEQSGRLSEILLRLAEYTERQNHIKRKVSQALIYPALMTVVSISIVIFMLVYVVPKIINVFEETHQSLPMVTIILLGVSAAVKKDGLYGCVLIVFFVFGFRRLLSKHASFQIIWHRWLLWFPLLGKSIRTVNSARFAHTFSILHGATVPVCDAMISSAELIWPQPMRSAVLLAITQIKEGVRIHKALQNTGYFTPLFIHLIASGESCGQLSEMLQKVAAQQEAEVELLIESVLTLFEPVMILMMGAVVLFIVLAIMLPIFSLDQMAG